MFKQDNESRDRLIFDIVTEYKDVSFGWTWKDISEDLCNTSNAKYNLTPSACRKAYKRYCDKLPIALKDMQEDEYEFNTKNANEFITMSLPPMNGKTEYLKNNPAYKVMENVKLDKPKQKQFTSIEIKDDKTQISERRLLMSETDAKSPEFCLIAHGYDPKLWEVVSIKNNFWDMSDGEDGIKTMYQSKLIARPITISKEFTLSDVKSFINVLAEHKFEHNFKLIPLDDSSEKYCLEVDWADIHIGSLSDEDEVGFNNYYKIALGNIKKVVAKIRKILNTGKVEKVVHNFLGDFLHFDNVEGNTAGGTELDVDSRPFKMVKKAFYIAMYIIDNTACVPMEVNSVLGNHSMMVEFTVFWALSLIYQNVKHISFNVDEKSRKVMVYGKVLVGLTHGNNIAKAEADLWLQNEFRQEWANCNYAEVHSGHLHQEILFSEKGGITKRTNPTLKIIDKYEHDHAWSSKKVVLAYLWHKEDNLQEIFYLK